LWLGVAFVTALTFFLLGFVLPTLWKAIQALTTLSGADWEQPGQSEAFSSAAQDRGHTPAPKIKTDDLRLAVRVDQRGQARVMTLAGDLDLYTSEALTPLLQTEIACRTVLPLVIDMTQVPYIDSSGWSTLVKARRALSAAGRTLSVILAPGTQPEQTYSVMSLETILPRTEPLSKAA
jgi:anti-anti-sigma factor